MHNLQKYADIYHACSFQRIHTASARLAISRLHHLRPKTGLHSPIDLQRAVIRRSRPLRKLNIAVPRNVGVDRIEIRGSDVYGPSTIVFIPSKVYPLIHLPNLREVRRRCIARLEDQSWSLG